MPRWVLWLFVIIPVLMGCASSEKKGVNPEFGLTALNMYGSIKFEGTSGEPIIARVAMRHENPGKFEMMVTKDPGISICRLVADGDAWRIEFPAENRTMEGKGTPSNEDLALWVETRRMITMAVKRVESHEDFTEVQRGEYDSGRHFLIQMTEFRRVVGKIFPTRMRLTCDGCKGSVEVVLHNLK